jgi:hypothetical protein
MMMTGHFDFFLKFSFQIRANNRHGDFLAANGTVPVTGSETDLTSSSKNAKSPSPG